jgi:IclR family pca regulon transcriptional regulator
MTEARERRQSLQSLERGIAVIQVFSRERPALTLSEVARLCGITRATARRILLTLEDLGHVRSDGRLFSLTPRVGPTSRARRRRSTCRTSSTSRACRRTGS